jgi:hypothetical protein
MSRSTDLVHRSLAPDTAETFEARVARQAATLRQEIAAGEFDNDEFAVGLEMEVYASDMLVGGDDGTGELRPLPESVFDGTANKELGLHNAELNTDPNVFDDDGLASQAEAIAADLADAQAATRETGRELVCDAMWTIPPESGSASYLGSVEDRDGVTVADNIRQAPRYLAIDNDVLAGAGGSIPFEAPGCSRTFPTMLFESLATSIQPHLQIPSAKLFPAYFNAAIRTLGPVLALGTNSPFLPLDLYDEVDDPVDLVEETHHELRIAVFEQSVNHTPNPKVKVPQDIDDPVDVVDRIVADDLCAPFLREWLNDGERDTFEDQFWEFDHKRTTYWRWVRCVVGGTPVGTGDERSLRIEYRPLPTQPTVSDVVGMQALVAGLLRGLVASDHPLTDLPRAAAEESFYSAARNGLAADLSWVTADGERTGDPEVIFEEVFALAREGLAAAGVAPDRIEQYLAPIEARWDAGETPSSWKKNRVRDALAEGQEFDDALAAMQRAYIHRSRETDSFAEWL